MPTLSQILRTADFTGVSDADAAVAMLALPPVTARPIPLATLAPYLRTYGVMAVLRAIADDADADPTRRATAQDFLGHLADVRQVNLDTTDPVVATRSVTMLADLQAAERIAPEQVAAIFAMGAGLVVPRTLTADDVAAARAANAAADLAAERQAAIMTRKMEWAAFYGRADKSLKDLAPDAPIPTIAQLVEIAGRA